MAEKKVEVKEKVVVKSPTQGQEDKFPWKWLVGAGIFMALLLGAIGLGRIVWNATAPVVQTAPSVIVVDNPQGSKVGFITRGQEVICRFVENYTSEGRVVLAGTTVTGPAFIKPDRDLDWGKPIYVGETYVTTASDEVVWLLQGDDACVNAQSQFFSYWRTTKP